MLKKLLLHFWNSRDQFAKYAITGCSAFVLDMGTLVLSIDFFKIDPVLAVAFNQILVICYVFFLNKLWSFKAQGDTRVQMLRFFLMVGFNYIVAIGWMWLWYKYFGFDAKIVRVANIMLGVSWNFLLYKHFVYRK